MSLEQMVYNGRIPKLRIILFLIIEIVFLIYVLVKDHKDGKNEPIDDSKSKIDMERMKAGLRQFIGNNQEQIVGILGQQYITNNIKNYGFCFLTDKAYYFIGNVFQKKHYFTWKSNIQHRIVINEMKGIKIKNFCPLRTIGFALYTVYSLYWNVKFIFLGASVGYYDMETLSDFDGVCIYISMFSIVIYFFCIIYGIVNLLFKRKTMIDIEFTTQIMRFPVSVLGKKEIKDFYKSVSQTQETVSNVINADNSKSIERTYAEPNGKGESKVEALAELSKLYEQNIIGQEEFEKLKKEIING